MTDTLRPVSFAKPRQSAPRLSAPYVPGRTSKRFWSEAEDAVLRERYPAGGVNAVAAALPERSASAIYTRVKALGLAASRSNPRRRFTPDLDQAIRDGWAEAAERGATTALADKLGLPRWALSQRARRLGLTTAQKKEPRWTAAEDALMRAVPLHNPDRCARIFRAHGFARSPSAIVSRAARLALSRRATHETLSARAVAAILGIDAKSITALCIEGRLPAERRDDRRLPQQGGAAWAIDPDDARAYILDNIANIDIRKVDKVALLDLMARPSKRYAQAMELAGALARLGDKAAAGDVTPLIAAARGLFPVEAAPG